MTAKGWNARLVGFVVVVGCCAGSAAEAQRPVSESCATKSDGMVEVENIAGSVKVIGWPEARVEVTGTLGEGVEGVSLECQEGRVEIEVELEDSKDRRRGGEAHLEVRVPSRNQVSVETVSATISVEGLSGRVSLESVSGGIGVHSAPAELEIESVTGEVHCAAAVANLEVETVASRVVLESVAGRTRAATVSGSVEVRGGTVEDGSFESVSGPLSFAGDLGAGGRLRLESHSGPVTVQLPPSLSARVRVVTFSGRVSNQLSPGAGEPESSGPAGGKELEFEVGGSAGEVSVKTFSGPVELLQR